MQHILPVSHERRLLLRRIYLLQKKNLFVVKNLFINVFLFVLLCLRCVEFPSLDLCVSSVCVLLYAYVRACVCVRSLHVCVHG